MISELRSLAGRAVGSLRRRLFPPPPPPPPPVPDVEIDIRLRSFADWAAFSATEGAHIQPDAAERIVAHARRDGVQCRFLGAVPASEVEMRGEDVREGLAVRGLNARQRAVLDSLANHEWAWDIHGVRIYAHEAVTEVALALRGRYPYFLGSEYAEDEAGAARLWPVPSIDITRSGLPDGAFHFVLSNEVLEHVPDLDAALHDTARILKPGGRLIATFPFRMSEETELRARMVNGTVEHLLPPEYHGNPMRPEEGSLVFQIPGWDILRRCREAGFSDAWIRFLASTKAGITANHVAGIFILEAER